MTNRPDEDEEKQDSFEFDDMGQERAYISLDQARVQAMSSAREVPGEYGRLSRSPMFFEVVETTETEDFYEVTLSFRPQGEFNGTPGQEIFFISKDGQLAHRQVESLPREERSRNPLRVGLLAVAFLGVVVAGVVGAAIAFGGFGGDGESPTEPAPVAGIPPPETPTRTQIAVVAQPTSAAASVVQISTPQPPTPSNVAGPMSTHTPVPALTPTPPRSPLIISVPRSTTRVPTRTATPPPGLFALSVATLPEAAISGGVQISGFGLYTAGTSVEVTATERTECRNNDIFQFSRWEGVDGDPNTLTSFVIMDRSREAVAVYEVINCATPTPTPLPNLRPGTPEGWDAPLVLTSRRSSFLEVPPAGETSFKEGDTVYAHWAIVNDSRMAVNTEFDVTLQVDGAVVQTFPVPRLGSGEFARLLNIPLQISGFGEHEVALVVDSSADVAELDESENSYSARVLVASRFRIAFTSDRDGNREIYVMNPDGSGQKRLTDTDTNESDPAWSPDGTKIAFYSTLDGPLEIYVMNATSSEQTRLTNTDGFELGPAWSPDGMKIAFSASRDVNWEIYVMSADGSGQTRLTNNTARDQTPAWSPNGTEIAFVSDRDGNREIYVMNADGSGQTRLTNSGANESDPAWSPDGTTIAFVSRSTRSIASEIHVMNADGSGRTRLSNRGATEALPAWSPDGTKIAFVSGVRHHHTTEIYVMNADGSGRTRLTNNSVSDTSPDWSPR